MRALVTGANRGIGLELTRQLQAQGAEVLAACRKSSPELDALGVQVLDGVDVADEASVAGLARRVDGPLDLLINNAGILSHEGLDGLDWEGMRRQFEVNSLGPLRVTSALLPRLGEGSKVGIVTSRMGSMSDNTSGGYYGYRMSKAAVNAAGVSLARDLAPRKIAVILLHPGWVQTGMTGGRGHLTAAESAQGLLARLEEASMQTSGRFWHANGEALPY